MGGGIVTVIDVKDLSKASPALLKLFKVLRAYKIYTNLRLKVIQETNRFPYQRVERRGNELKND